MVFVDKIDVTLSGSITDAAGIDTRVVGHGFSRCTFHAQQSKFTCQFYLVVGYVANLSTGLTYQPQTMT